MLALCVWLSVYVCVCLLIFYDIQVPYVCVRKCACMSRVFVFPPGKKQTRNFCASCSCCCCCCYSCTTQTVRIIIVCCCRARFVLSWSICPSVSLTLSRCCSLLRALFWIRFQGKINWDQTNWKCFRISFFFLLFRVCIFVATYFHKQMWACKNSCACSNNNSSSENDRVEVNNLLGPVKLLN